MPPLGEKLASFARVPDWHFSLILVLELLFIFVALPTLNLGATGHNIVPILQTLLAAAAILLTLQTTTARLVLAASYALSLLGRFLPGGLSHVAGLTVYLIYQAILTFAVASAVLAPGRVNKHRIAGAVFVYLNVAQLFAVMFAELLAMQPDAIAGTGGNAHAYPMLHFSFALLTSRGDSAFVPQSPFAQSLADCETVIGQLFPAILLGRLVGLHITGTAEDRS